MWWIAVSSPIYFCQQWSHRWNTTVSGWQNNHMSRGEWQSNTQDELKVWACEEGSNYSELVILDNTVSCSCKHDDLLKLPNNFSLITREAGDKGPTNFSYKFPSLTLSRISEWSGPRINQSRPLHLWPMRPSFLPYDLSKWRKEWFISRHPKGLSVFFYNSLKVALLLVASCHGERRVCVLVHMCHITLTT